MRNLADGGLFRVVTQVVIAPKDALDLLIEACE